MRRIFFGKKSMWDYIHAFTRSHSNRKSDTFYSYTKVPVLPIYILNELTEDIVR